MQKEVLLPFPCLRLQRKQEGISFSVAPFTVAVFSPLASDLNAFRSELPSLWLLLLCFWVTLVLQRFLLAFFAVVIISHAYDFNVYLSGCFLQCDCVVHPSASGPCAVTMCFSSLPVYDSSTVFLSGIFYSGCVIFSLSCLQFNAFRRGVPRHLF